MALTGEAWNVDNPEKPWALFDNSATTEIVLPFDITDWLAELSSSYASHQIIADPPLNAVASGHSVGVISVRMKLASAAVFKDGLKYPFTIRLVCADAQTDDRTLWLKLKSR